MKKIITFCVLFLCCASATWAQVNFSQEEKQKLDNVVKEIQELNIFDKEGHIIRTNMAVFIDFINGNSELSSVMTNHYKEYESYDLAITNYILKKKCPAGVKPALCTVERIERDRGGDSFYFFTNKAQITYEGFFGYVTILEEGVRQSFDSDGTPIER